MLRYESSTVVKANNLTLVDLLRALQSSNGSSISFSSSNNNNDDNNNNLTKSSSEQRMNYNNNVSWLMEAAAGGGTDELVTGPISDWLMQLTRSEGQMSASSFVSSSILSQFIQQVRFIH